MDMSADRVEAEEKRVFSDLLGKDGTENPYDLRHELRLVMDDCMGVYRSAERLESGLARVRAIRARFADVTLTDRNRIYNANLVNTLELENLLELAEIAVIAALAREESRGAHARTDFPDRDDDNWLRHTLVRQTDKGPRLDYKPVAITHWQPVERKY